jgi:hypothetical protein
MPYLKTWFYTTVLMQASVLREDDGSIAAITPDYYPEDCMKT